jgi:hypothetical protein
MGSLFDFLINQVGVQGIFFVFTLILSTLFYQEKKADKEEFKEREQQQLEREAKLSDQLDKSIEALQELKLVSKKLDDLSSKIKK